MSTTGWVFLHFIPALPPPNLGLFYQPVLCVSEAFAFLVVCSCLTFCLHYVLLVMLFLSLLSVITSGLNIDLLFLCYNNSHIKCYTH